MIRKRKGILAIILVLCMLLSMGTPALAAQAGSVKLNKSKISITVGQTTTLTAAVTGLSKKVTWKSSQPSIASVNSKGKVSGKKAGTAVISAKANGQTAKCTVIVKKKSNSYVKQGQYFKKNASPRPGTVGSGDFITVQKLSGGKIKFVAEHYGINGSPFYRTNVITAKLNGNKVSKFSWQDTWGNRGTGSLSFGKNKATLKMNTTYLSKFNRWGWQKTLTLPYKKSMTTTEVKECLKDIF